MTARTVGCSLFLLVLPCAVAAQRSPRILTGVVVSESTGLPVSGVLVTANPPGLMSRSDTAGFFELVGVSSDEFDIQFRRLGFAPVTFTVMLEDTVEIGSLGAVRLEPIATPLPDVVVEGERRNRRLNDMGFYDRRKLGFGSFMEAEAIEDMNPNRVTEVVNRMKGFTVVPNQNYMKPLPPQRSAFGYTISSPGGVDTRQYVIQPRRGRVNCSAIVFVDGIRVGTTLDTDIDRYVHPLSIQGIEAYAGPADVPTEYNKDGAECGAFVIWTR